MSGHEDLLEELMSHLGEFGTYQLWQLILLLIPAMTAGLHTISIVTINGVPNHRCRVPWVDNSTEAEWLSPSALLAIPKNEDGSLSSCLLKDPTNNLSLACDEWVYDSTYFKETRTVEWDLVCDKKWLGALSKSIFMLGVFCGAFSLGTLADKYGRKKLLCISATLQIIVSIGIAFVNDFYLYLVVSFFYGMFGSAGSYLTAFVIIMELVGPTKRTVCGLLFQANFALGIMLVAVWGYFISDYFTLQLVYGAHSLLLIGHWWLTDESPRWLWSQGRIKESVNIVSKAVRMNGGQKIDKAFFVSKGKAKTTVEPSAGFTDLFKSPRLRLRTINLTLNWLSNSLAYYGLSLAGDNMAGNPFFIIFVLGLVEIPSYLMVIIVLDRTGRRSLTSTMMILGALACALTGVIPRDMSNTLTAVACVGKFCISGSFAIIYNYSAELLPTVVRNAGVGCGSACARLGAMFCPIILLLDSIDKSLPAVVFASFAFVSGILTLFLPETLNKPMPQSIDDGENFGIGDTAFSNLCNSRKKTNDYVQPNPI